MRAAAVALGIAGIFPLFIFSFTIVSSFPVSEVGDQFTASGGHRFDGHTHALATFASEVPDSYADTRQDGAHAKPPSIPTLTDVGAGFRFHVGSIPHPNSIDSRKEQLLDDDDLEYDDDEFHVSEESSSASGIPTAAATAQSSTIKLINIKNENEDTELNAEKEADKPSPTEEAEEQVAESTQNSPIKPAYLHRLQAAGILLPQNFVTTTTIPTTTTTTTTEAIVIANAGLVNAPPPPITPEVRGQQSISPYFTAYSFDAGGPLSILSEYHRGNYFAF